jgi:hypothetical protein
MNIILNWQGPDAHGNDRAFVDYGVLDENGRKVGGMPVIFPPGAGYYTQSHTSFTLSLYTTRDGVKFGAIPRPTFYATMEEAKTACEKKVKAAKLRFMKKFVYANMAKEQQEMSDEIDVSSLRSGVDYNDRFGDES